MGEQASSKVAAMWAYLALSSPPVCPRCGAWDGPNLPMCTDPGWTHDDSCALIRYAEDVCAECANAMRADPTTDGATA